MSAKSKRQQQLMAMALEYKRGKMLGASDEVIMMSKSMDSKQLEDYAKTKRKDLPEKISTMKNLRFKTRGR